MYVCKNLICTGVIWNEKPKKDNVLSFVSDLGYNLFETTFKYELFLILSILVTVNLAITPNIASVKSLICACVIL